MPHIIVKLWPGQTAEQKANLSDQIVKAVKNSLGYGDESISVGFEEVRSSEWAGKVYKPDIKGKWDTLTKKPGYRM